MNKQPLISIIIPVYNVEKYLNACIDSVLKQTYFNIEIVLVNDGSIDSSGDICNQYQLRDARIKVIHLENGGVSRARNKGIEVCSGDYICFIDSDDTIESSYIQDFKDSIEENIEIYIQGTNIIKQDGTKNKVSYKAISIMDIYGIFNTNNLCGHGYAHGKMYHSSLIKNNNIKFQEVVKFSEDLLFILECLLYTNKIKYIDRFGYNYFLRIGNASSKNYSFETELTCWKNFSLSTCKISAKYELEIIKIRNVAEIYAMLFARVRNAIYMNKLSKSIRLSFFYSLNENEKETIYNYKYISNIFIQLGYILLHFNLIKIMDTYFNLLYSCNSLFIKK